MSAVVKGWCPSLQRPMASADGLIARIKPRAARLTAAEAERLAALAQHHGNGTVELTQRGNIQLRGIEKNYYSSLCEEITSSGLAAGEATAEAVRNIQCSPFSPAEDAAAAFDAPAVAMALEDALLGDELLRQLPGKFGFAVDGGGNFALGRTQADITLRPAALPGHIVVEAAGYGLETTREAAPGMALAIARAFLLLSRQTGQPARRLHNLAETIHPAAIFSAAELPGPRPCAAPAAAALQLGIVPLAGTSALAAAPPFGRLEASQLTTLAGIAKAGDGTLRLGGQRRLMIPGLEGARAEWALAEARALGLVVAADDARLRIDVCSGAPACPQGEAPTLELARQLAGLLAPAPASLHVSGCTKGCARARAADITLTARAGRFDVIRKGRASDPPFASGLEVPELIQLVQSLAAEFQDRT